MKLGYNNICSIIGRKVIFQIFLGYLKNNNKFLNIITGNNLIELIQFYNSESKSIDLFLSSIKFQNIDYIKLGNFLLETLMAYPVTLFEKTFDEEVSEVAKLKISEGNFEAIKSNFIVDPASLPMLTPPTR